MPDSNVDLEVHLAYQAASPIGKRLDRDLESYILHMHADIVGWNFDIEASPALALPLGSLTFELVRVGNAINDGADLDAIFDLSQETRDADNAIFNTTYTQYQPAIECRYDAANLFGDIMLLHQITIESFARGQRLGLAVLDRVMRDCSGGCALAVIKPFPLQLTRGARARPDWDREQLGRSPRGQRKALESLRGYCSRLGFERLGHSKHFAFLPSRTTALGAGS